MYTQCPECQTTFKLGADELRQRRTAKCVAAIATTVFNALEYLAEEVEEEAVATEAAAWQK